MYNGFANVSGFAPTMLTMKRSAGSPYVHRSARLQALESTGDLAIRLNDVAKHAYTGADAEAGVPPSKQVRVHDGFGLN